MVIMVIVVIKKKNYWESLVITVIGYTQPQGLPGYGGYDGYGGYLDFQEIITYEGLGH